MKRKGIAMLCLLAVIALLSGCSGQPSAANIPEITQYVGPALTPTPTPEPTAEPDVGGNTDGASVFDVNPYDVNFTADDAMNEEGYASADSAVDATVYPYAGSTPIPLLPVDAPTPTPRPSLTFTYVPFVATALGLSFEGPAGWNADESVDETYTLSEPESQMKDGQLGIVTLYAVPVSSSYTESNLKSEVQQRLNTIGATGFSVWKPSLTATRYLLGGKGVYANYTGTLSSGVEVGGRIHCTCIANKLYCLQIIYPLGFKDDYLNVFSQIRQTLARTD